MAYLDFSVKGTMAQLSPLSCETDCVYAIKDKLNPVIIIRALDGEGCTCVSCQF